jgi:hypothetical protein
MSTEGAFADYGSPEVIFRSSQLPYLPRHAYLPRYDLIQGSIHDQIESDDIKKPSEMMLVTEHEAADSDVTSIGTWRASSESRTQGHGMLWMDRKEDGFIDPKRQIEAFAKGLGCSERKHVGLRASRATVGLNLWLAEGFWKKINSMVSWLWLGLFLRVQHR